MKVYDHQKTPGKKLLPDFDDILRATIELDKKGKRVGGKRQHDEQSIEHAANHKQRKPFRTYGAEAD